MAKRLAEQGIVDQKVKSCMMEAARKYNCSVTELKSLVEYPEDIDW